ncbi:TPA: hypothetical protein EYO12_02760 [Candidatus Saccharibacteria bacterium]|nr:hypothetical protein [Candidatus Saccharibacteria bacterium]HIO88040.1 hypothetical protein [Candidatus Saccharibacteria bacterium]
MGEPQNKNILSVSDAIEAVPDLSDGDLRALSAAVGMEQQNRRERRQQVGSSHQNGLDNLGPSDIGTELNSLS